MSGDIHNVQHQHGRACGLRRGGRYLLANRGLPAVEVKTTYHSTWLDNTKAKLILGWRPRYDMQKIMNTAWKYVRAEDDPRTIWYPG